MLTKAFVVLVTILSVLLAALTTSYVASTGDIRAQLEDTEQQLAAERQEKQQLVSELAAMDQRRQRQLDNLRNQIDDLNGQVTSLQSERQSLETDLLAERARVTELTASLSGLDASNQQIAGLLEDVTEELGQRRDQVVDQQQKLIEATDRVASLDSQLASYDRQVRRLREEKVALEAEHRELRAYWDQVPREVRVRIASADEQLEDGGTVRPPHAIEGQVVRVERSGDETIVQINVGTNDAVAQNMEFVVSREGQFIGALLIERVDDDAAVGRMTLREQSVQQGDRIYASPDMASAGP